MDVVPGEGAGAGSGAGSGAGFGAAFGVEPPRRSPEASGDSPARPAAMVPAIMGSSKLSFIHAGAFAEAAAASVGLSVVCGVCCACCVCCLGACCSSDAGPVSGKTSWAQDGTPFVGSPLAEALPVLATESRWPPLAVFAYQSGKAGVVIGACVNGALVVVVEPGDNANGPMPGRTRLRSGPWTVACKPLPPPKSKAGLVRARELPGMLQKKGELVLQHVSGAVLYGNLLFVSKEHFL
mmetsp:Transcript_41381/g.81763  ORF Transcript_41381/g.81763 Transcript_41381/m.81763 type:complete len:238 (+) Transcript_41381:262-975(+)